MGSMGAFHVIEKTRVIIHSNSTQLFFCGWYKMDPDSKDIHRTKVSSPQIRLNGRQTVSRGKTSMARGVSVVSESDN